jgi:hypothetical protein
MRRRRFLSGAPYRATAFPFSFPVSAVPRRRSIMTKTIIYRYFFHGIFEKNRPPVSAAARRCAHTRAVADRPADFRSNPVE